MDWKSKNVLVTGGNGFLGSRLVKMLKEKHAKINTIHLSINLLMKLIGNLNQRKILYGLHTMFLIHWREFINWEILYQKNHL